MGSRLLLGAAMMLAAFAFPVASQAADAHGAHAKKHHGAQHHRYNHVGGHRYWYQNESFPFNPQNNAPGHYNNQTFWERVETQRNYPVGY
jgi:hypothetical protein